MPVSFRLSADALEALKQYAYTQHRSVSDVVKGEIERLIQEARHGLVAASSSERPAAPANVPSPETLGELLYAYQALALSWKRFMEAERVDQFVHADDLHWDAHRMIVNFRQALSHRGLVGALRAADRAMWAVARRGGVHFVHAEKKLGRVRGMLLKHRLPCC